MDLYRWNVFTFVYQAADNNKCGSFADDVRIVTSILPPLAYLSYHLVR